MSILQNKVKRRILPRWRISLVATQATEFSSLKPAPPIIYNRRADLLQAIESFEADPSPGTASELIAISMLSKSDESARIAVEYILQNKDDVPHSLLNLAESVFSNKNEDTRQRILASSVSRTRTLLRIQPNNPLLWSDMARHYASVGDKKQAFRCMQTVQQLAPNLRWMLRTTARFLVHQEDPVAAHKLLSNHPRTKNDPWLIAAEMACAHVAGRKPKYWRQASDIIKWGQVAPVHLSELATAMGMMELEGGNTKLARKYVHKGLISPTENTLAQIYWAKENSHLSDEFQLEEKLKSATDAYEADYRLNLIRGDFLGALDQAQKWSEDEPFAARPKYEIAYVASILDAYDLTEEMAHQVYQMDRKIDPSLELNRVFSVISSGKLTLEHNKYAIDKLYDIIIRSTENKSGNTYHALANLGLWHYRYGDLELGRKFYLEAIQSAQKQHSHEAAVMAAIFAAREALISKSDVGFGILGLARTLANKTKFKAGEFYMRKLEALRLDPNNAMEILSPKFAARFLDADKKSQQFRIEKTKSGTVLWVPGKPKSTKA